MQTIRIVIFIIATLANFAFSWRALKIPKCHGFYRFFVFQAIALLVPLNLPFWFTHPFSLQQTFSWIFLILSGIYAIAGFYYLIKFGKPKASARADCNYTFESTSVLVQSGWYRYIRHPMYGSLMFFAWGAFLKRIDWVSFLCVFFASIFVYWTARTEEKENQRAFGPAYLEYMKKTKRFIPYIF